MHWFHIKKIVDKLGDLRSVKISYWPITDWLQLTCTLLQNVVYRFEISYINAILAM